MYNISNRQLIPLQTQANGSSWNHNSCSHDYGHIAKCTLMLISNLKELRKKEAQQFCAMFQKIWRCGVNQGVLTERDGHTELQCRIWREGLAEVRGHVYHIPAPPAGHKSYVVSLKD